jgi:(R,R)-butanediol dehydrogenase/meso-butanediol dehydrogenase/diacetyl reductase
MKALVLESTGTLRVGERAEPEAVVGEVLVAPAYVGVCGTDLHIIDGLHPRATFPLILGHEIVGVVADGPSAGSAVVVDPTISCGRCSACLLGLEHVCENLRLVGIDRDGGMAERVLVDETKLHAVPQRLNLEAAALAEPLAVAVHAVRRSGLEAGCRVVVCGGGPIGLLTALVAQAAGASCVLVEPGPARREGARHLGVDAVADADEVPRRLGGLADVAFDAAAVAPVALLMPTLVRPGGVVVVEAVYSAPVPVDLQHVTFRELSLVGTRVYTPSDIDDALDLLVHGVVDAASVVSEIVAFDGFAGALEGLRQGDSLKVLVDCTSP